MILFYRNNKKFFFFFVDPKLAVSHVWNAATHAAGHNQFGPTGNYNQYHPGGGSNVVSEFFGGNR
jgi:hypothetical protein